MFRGCLSWSKKRILPKEVNYSGLSKYEKLQILLSFLSLVVLIFTALTAAWIGIVQNGINQHQLDLDREPALVITLKKDDGSIAITNVGKVGLTVTAINIPESDDEELPVAIPVANYLPPSIPVYFEMENVDGAYKYLFEKAENDKTHSLTTVPFSLDVFTTPGRERYKIKAVFLLAKRTTKDVTVDTAIVSIEKR